MVILNKLVVVVVVVVNSLSPLGAQNMDSGSSSQTLFICFSEYKYFT